MKETILKSLSPFALGFLLSSTLFLGADRFLLPLSKLSPTPGCSCCCGGECKCPRGACDCPNCKCPAWKKCRPPFPDGSLPK